MPDVFTKAKRSEVMSHIRGHGNKETELALIKIFRQHNITGWRRHRPFFGKPDFVFPKQKVAVFVDGCFWHGCPRHSNLPVNNRVFWSKKMAANKARDRLVNRTLRKQGWRVVRIWEHALRNPQRCIQRIWNQRCLELNSAKGAIHTSLGPSPQVHKPSPIKR